MVDERILNGEVGGSWSVSEEEGDEKETEGKSGRF